MAFQETFWKKINDFVSDGNRYLEKVDSQLANSKNKETDEENKRKERINQLKVEGQLEAARLYEKYQSRKIDELKFVKELLAKEWLEI